MKTRSSFAPVLLAMLGIALVSPLAAASPEPIKAYRVGKVVRYGVTAVRPDDSAAKVVAYLGKPDQKLSPDAWVYRRFMSQPGEAQAEGCNTLVISFRHGRVVDLQRTNEPGTLALAARFVIPADSALVIAGK